jgi:hypothetical protein
MWVFSTLEKIHFSSGQNFANIVQKIWPKNVDQKWSTNVGQKGPQK